MLFAFFLRSYHIGSIPAGLYPDEAVNAADALYANETGNYLLFYPNNYGREGLFINLQALSLKAFGATLPALKLWSVIFGTFAALGMYFLGKELFKRRSAGLIAAFIVATSFWAINFSRIGFRAIMVTFLLSFAFFFLFRGLRTRRLADFTWGGLFFGLGLHTYVAFRLAPLILVILLPALILSYEDFFRRYFKHLLIFVFAAFVSAAPMFYHFFIAHPWDFSSRSAAVSIFAPEINHGDFLGTLGKTFGTSLLKYIFWGDQNWSHNYPPYPILDPFVGTFFLAGFLYILWQTIVLVGRRIRDGDRDTRLVTDFFLLGSFFVMLMPEFLTNEGLPHALRAIGTQTPVFLMATLPAFWLTQKALRSQTGTRMAFLSIVVIALAGSAVFNITKYFVFFAQSPHQAAAFNLDFRNMAEYLLTLPPETKKYVVSTDRSKIQGNHLPINAQPIFFQTYGKIQNLTYLLPDSDAVISEGSIIILMHRDDRIIENIRKFSPKATAETIDLHPGTGSDFTIIRIR
jgi:4-amino-4-deoxy-L-arabinose transferase-like glycosyltransferase